MVPGGGGQISVKYGIVIRWPYAFDTPYGFRGWNGVVSDCGTSPGFPKISLLEAWKNRAFGVTFRIASRIHEEDRGDRSWEFYNENVSLPTAESGTPRS